MLKYQEQSEFKVWATCLQLPRTITSCFDRHSPVRFKKHTRNTRYNEIIELLRLICLSLKRYVITIVGDLMLHLHQFHSPKLVIVIFGWALLNCIFFALDSFKCHVCFFSTKTTVHCCLVFAVLHGLWTMAVHVLRVFKMMSAGLPLRLNPMRATCCYRC